VNTSSDPGGSEGEPFEREPVDAERGTGDPGEAFADGDRETGSGPDTPGTTPPTALENVEVDPELRVLFWKLVLLYKISIIGGTLGV